MHLGDASESVGNITAADQVRRFVDSKLDQIVAKGELPWNDRDLLAVTAG